MSSSCAHCTPSCTAGWDSHLPVCCHGVPVYLLGIMRGSACALSRGFAGTRESDRVCTSGLELRQLPETKSSGSSLCAPLPLCHHDMDFQCLEENMPEHLYQKHIFEGSPEEKPMLIWVNAASCILQTTTVKDVTYLCVPSETSQMPSKTSEKPLPPWIICATNPQQICFNNSILSSFFFPGSVRSNS